MTISQAERDTYQEVNALEAYGEFSPGEQWRSVFLQIVGTDRGTLLDAGCMSGKAGVALAQDGFDVTLCDMTDAGLIPDAARLPFHEVCLWRDLSSVARDAGRWGRTRFDWVYCCDVLEHVPPEFTMLVVDQLLRITKRGLFLTIALVPDSFGAWVGKPLHQTVQSFVWWRDHLSEIAELLDARDCHPTGVFFVRGRDDESLLPVFRRFTQME